MSAHSEKGSPCLPLAPHQVNPHLFLMIAIVQWKQSALSRELNKSWKKMQDFRKEVKVRIDNLSNYKPVANECLAELG